MPPVDCDPDELPPEAEREIYRAVERIGFAKKDTPAWDEYMRAWNRLYLDAFATRPAVSRRSSPAG
jgi:hypothetical protein